MTRFTLIFVLYLAVLFSLSLYKPVDEGIVGPFTALLAQISMRLMHVFDPQIVAQGDILRNQATGFSVQIVRGCNAVDAVLILVSAILAFPAAWKNRLLGIGLGFFAIQSVNLLRIISLFYLGQWSRLWFDWAHLYLWQALIILDALMIWLVWLHYLPQPSHNKRDSVV